MGFGDLDNQLSGAGTGVLRRLGEVFGNPLSDFSILSLFSAFLIAGLFLVLRRRGRRRVRLRALWRALLPRRWMTSRSVRADIGMLLLNLFVTASLVGWAIMTHGFVFERISALLNAGFGAGSPIVVPRLAMATILTVALYLAAETAYFIDHYLKHHVPVLWHFHRVHHTAEALTPLTNARMHPVDSVVFANIVALVTGAASALVLRHFTAPGEPVVLICNAILVAALYLLIHLQHSHMWIAFTGRLGRWVLSPAHHQIHHSADPSHFNRNLGATLAVFDRLAGTLHVPDAKRPRLSFGAGPYDYDPHSVSGLLIQPFADAAREIVRTGREGEKAEPASSPLVTR